MSCYHEVPVSANRAKSGDMVMGRLSSCSSGLGPVDSRIGIVVDISDNHIIPTYVMSVYINVSFMTASFVFVALL